MIATQRATFRGSLFPSLECRGIKVGKNAETVSANQNTCRYWTGFSLQEKLEAERLENAYRSIELEQPYYGKSGHFYSVFDL